MRIGHELDTAQYYPLPKGIFEKYQFSSVYVTSPVYFDESFCLFETDSNVGDEPDTVLPVWFVPIFKSEEKYIEKYGADRFEELLFEPDELVDFNREHLVQVVLVSYLEDKASVAYNLIRTFRVL